MSASIKDVAKLAGVSISTVSSVINKNKNVSMELTIKIEDAIKQLGYRKNPVASGLKSKQTKTIGVLLTQITSIYFPQLLQGLEDIIFDSEYNLTFSTSNNEIEREQYYIELMENRWVDGIILDSIANSTDHKKYIEYLNEELSIKKGIPIVSLSEDIIMQSNISAVIVDNREGAIIAINHLLSFGHKKIAHIQGLPKNKASDFRLEGYKTALMDKGININPKLIKIGDFSPSSGYTVMKELLQEGEEFTAVFSCNDQMAIGAIKAIREAGLKVPEDIAIIGFDNIPMSTLINPALTTINVPKYRIGADAAKVLITKLSNPENENKVEVLPANLIIRNSTDVKANTTWDLFGW